MVDLTHGPFGRAGNGSSIILTEEIDADRDDVKDGSNDGKLTNAYAE
jgi:hypothetical protein